MPRSNRKSKPINRRAAAFAVKNKFRAFPIIHVVQVCTGDVIEVVFDLGFGLSKKERIGLSGIVAPSIRTKAVEEKNLGDIAKMKLDHMLANSSCIECVIDGKDSAGRHTGVLFDTGPESVNERMMNGGFVWSIVDSSKDLEMLRVLQGSEF